MIRKIFLKYLNKHASKWLVLSIDILILCISFIIAYGIRFNLSFNFKLNNIVYQLPVIAILGLISFLFTGSYKGIIRHTGIKDAFNIFIGVTLFSFGLFFILTLNQFVDIIPSFTIPSSIVLIHYLVSIFILVISRFVFKAFYEVVSSEVSSITSVLIYGAGEAGIITYNSLTKDSKYNYEVVAYVDDNPNKANKKIDRIPVLGPKKITKDFVKRNNISQVIISTQAIRSNRLLEITDKFIGFGMKIKGVPAFSQWIDGDLSTNQIKDINIDDLLGRDQITVDNPIVKRDVKDKVILVTGAAGSIGSEISRQLIQYPIQKLLLVDQAESDLYDLQQDFHLQGYTNFEVKVADVRDKQRMRSLFELYQPQYVYHAAAYKHVPLMEESPYEAVKVNVLGTQKIADLSVEFEVERFVMVSTDKAVNPSNVMGATKRVAEMYISCLSEKQDATKFTTTRFGNVLGSNGSVIPLFKKQILQGGPLTVTHKDITRYFMTIPEACKLVLEAGTMGNGGEIYIFDMGKSVKIYNMAKRMIALSGLRYPDDIDIKITGLRPGEKLYEELLANGESTLPTYHEKIMIAKTQTINSIQVTDTLELLNANINSYSNQEIVELLKVIVPEYVSNNSEFEVLDT